MSVESAAQNCAQRKGTAASSARTAIGPARRNRMLGTWDKTPRQRTIDAACPTRAARGPLEPSPLLGDAGGLHAVARAELLNGGREGIAHGPLGEIEAAADTGAAR